MFKSIAALLIVTSTIALATPAIAAATKPATEALVTTQLPRTARPTHYAIHVTPNAAALSFKAQAKIDIELLVASNSVTLHAADLTFKSVNLTNRAGKIYPAKTSLNEAAQTATFTLPAALPAGRYTIDADYSGKIYQQASGLFALDYKDTSGAEKRSLFTQFEAPDARRFVPSWDEPNYKATFALTATVPADQMAVSNMPIASQKAAGENLVDVTFKTSPKMSTYLLFFGLGEFDRITKQVGPTEVGVIVGRGNGEKGRYALDASAKIVEYYNDYFGVPYPLPKLDNVAAPGQSQFFSAMENWGAIFTFEPILLLDPKITSARGQQTIFVVGAHEIAHQWFGNLVTMQWWDDLWLNEGFASWMENKTTAHFNPDWKADLSRVGGRESAMAADAYVTTHPVIQKIETVEQTSQAFDTITYQKGQAVISMLEGFAGADVWRDGIRSYIKKHAYGNTRTDDLWSAVEAAGAKGLINIAHDYTKKPGVPLIKVKSATCTSGNTNVALEQGEFSRDRKARADAKPLRWQVPVLAQTLGGQTVRTVVTNGATTLTVPGCGALVMNAGQSGYYRVLYTPATMAALNKNFAKLSDIDQLGLLNDSLRLSNANYQPMAVALDLLSAVQPTASSQVIEDSVNTYISLHERFKGNAASQARIAALATARFGPVLQKIGLAAVPGELLINANLRATLISTLGIMGDTSVNAEAQKLFAALNSNPAALDGPLRTSWLRVLAYNADQATWDKLRGLGKAAENQVIKSTMYSLLGQTRDVSLAKQALALALTQEPGSTTRAAIIAAVAEEHPELAVDFALRNLKVVETLVDASSRSQFIGELATGSRDAAMPSKLDAYAKKYLTPTSRKTVDQAIASIRTRIATEPRIKAGVVEWLGRQ
jgi:aminopeptidase N